MASTKWLLMTVLQGNVYAIMICWIFGIIGFIGNGYVIYTSLKNILSHGKSGRANRVHAFLIFNLAVADVCGSLYLVIMSLGDLYLRIHVKDYDQNISCIANVNCTHKTVNVWTSSAACSLARAMSSFALQLPGLLMLLMSIDRYITIVKPYTSHSLSYKKAKIVVSLFYIYSLFNLIVIVIRSDKAQYPYNFDNFINLCFFNEFYDPILVVVTNLFFAVIILTYLLSMIFYILIIISIRHSRTHCASKNNTIVANRVKAERRICKVTGVLAVTNLISWLPGLIFTVFKIMESQIVENKAGDTIGVVLFLLLFINSSVNPIMFVVMTSQRFKAHCKCKKNSIGNYHSTRLEAVDVKVISSEKITLS